MVEHTTPFRGPKNIRTEIDQLVGRLDFRDFGNQAIEFGRQNPLALAFAAMTVGLAAGLLMKKTLAASEKFRPS